MIIFGTIAEINIELFTIESLKGSFSEENWTTDKLQFQKSQE